MKCDNYIFLLYSYFPPLYHALSFCSSRGGIEPSIVLHNKHATGRLHNPECSLPSLICSGHPVIIFFSHTWEFFCSSIPLPYVREVANNQILGRLDSQKIIDLPGGHGGQINDPRQGNTFLFRFSQQLLTLISVSYP